MRSEPPNEIDRSFPTVEDGVKGLAFAQAAMQSSATAVLSLSISI
jgi:hypothetical protein